MKQKLIIGFATLSFLSGVAGALSEYKVKEVSAAIFTTTTSEQLATITDEKEKMPIIKGYKNWDVQQGEELNVLDGVSAETRSGEAVQVVASSYSTTEVKQQEVTLTARDSNGNLATEIISVNVKAIEEEKIEEPEIVITEQSVSQYNEQTEIPIVEKTVTQKEIAQPKEIETPTWQASTMYLGGISVPYQNAGEGSGQSIIDANRNMIATFGGAAIQSPNDGINTHFIGHNPGIFSILFSLGIGSEVTVTDTNGIPSTYIVGNIFEVDDYGTNTATKENYVDYILDPGTEERITLQTCINDDINLIVIAFPA